MMRKTTAALLAIISLSACGSDGGTPAMPDAAPLSPDATPGPGPATALFELPRNGGAPSEFYALPFPNDMRLQADGTVNVSDYPSTSDLVNLYISLSGSTHGFGVNSAIFFRFSNAIDPAGLPATAADSLADSSPIYLINVDPASPYKGEKIPLRFRFEPKKGFTIGTNWLSCLPYPGFPLHGQTTYALVITNAIKASDGSAITRSADFDAVMSTAATSDAAVTKARALYAPLFAYLDAAAGGRAVVADATVFTTEDATGFMKKVHDFINAPCDGAVFPACIPEPVAENVVNDGVKAGGAYTVIEGTYPGPNFQQGDVPYLNGGGEIDTDANGTPIPVRMEDIRFSVTLPPGPVPANGWPVVIYAHGTGGDYMSYIDDGSGGHAAAQGMAMISIDQVLHGPRNPGGNPDIDFFNVYNPVAFRDNVRQGALDDFQLVRLTLGLSLADGARTHTFDATRMYFMGHSQGGLTGPPFLAYEPYIKGAVLSGAAGLLYIAVQYKTEPIDITSIINLVIPDSPLDDFNPVLAMVQMGADSADPCSYGPLLVREPPAGRQAMDIYQSEGFVDSYAPDPGIEAFGTSMGLSQVGPLIQPIEGFALRGKTTLTAPVSDNLDGHSGVLLQYTMTPGSDGHFVVFDVPAAERQWANFLGTLAATGTATLTP